MWNPPINCDLLHTYDCSTVLAKGPHVLRLYLVSANARLLVCSLAAAKSKAAVSLAFESWLGPLYVAYVQLFSDDLQHVA